MLLGFVEFTVKTDLEKVNKDLGMLGDVLGAAETKSSVDINKLLEALEAEEKRDDHVLGRVKRGESPCILDLKKP